jgi:4-oxalocrotonate tautomerase
MPIVQIDMLEGRTDDQKRTLVRMVTEAICEALEAKPETVRIIVRDMRREHYSVGGVLASERKAN